MSLKEKFQITLPDPTQEDEGWADLSTAQTKKGEHPYNNRTAFEETDGKFNETAPGMDITNQFRETPNMPYHLDGHSDVTKNDKDFLKKGYSRAKMTGTDDQYTGEHIDLFYGTAYGDSRDEIGFIERNNYLDRQ